MASQQARASQRVEDLHLDRVVASRPELGPAPPDGGYGWLILASAVVYHVTTPAILILYGFIILKSLREEDHEIEENFKIWDIDIALVPVIMVVIKLLLESWCRTVVKTFNMPRFMALAGLCLTVAGVLLSSYSTNADENDHVINVFAGIFAGTGCALTGQQTEVIITHYFRDKLTFAQRIVRVAPSLGHVLIPILIGYLSTKYAAESIVMIYGAILMQNCFFLASFTRPIYIEKVIRSTYNMITDGVEDDDEVIFSNQSNRNGPEPVNSQNFSDNPGTSAQDEDQVVVFNSKQNAKEILDPSVQLREKTEVNVENRFSSDFSAMRVDSNRFSSDFGDMRVDENRFSSDFSNLNTRTSGYQELRSIERAPDPEPLYRETTIVGREDNAIAFSVNPDLAPGPARRTASLKKNFFTIVNMLQDLNFYLYTLLHLSTTFSVTMLSVVFPPMIWEQNQSRNIFQVAIIITIAHASAMCVVFLCIALPKSLSEKSRLCATFCATGALGFYGITISSGASLLAVWGTFAGFSTAAASVLQQPIYNNILNEFDTTATIATANTFVATFIMIWSVSFNYDYRMCFHIAAALQGLACVVFLASSFRRNRR